MKDNVKLGTLGDIFIGLTYRPEDVANEGTIVLRSTNIQNGRLGFDDIVRVKCKVRENLIVKPNDILMCSRNGSAKLVGKCTLLPEMDEEMSFGAFMTIIRTQHNPYLLHFFNSNAFRCQLGSAATTTINQITRKMLDDISVPIYPKEQEEYIVTVLNQIDELIWIEAKKLDQLDELVKSRFIELFGDPVASKNKRKLSEIGRVFTGNTPSMKEPSYYESNDIPFIKPSDLNESGVTYIDGVEAYVSEKARPVARIIPPQAVLVTCIGTIGKIGITARESCCNQQINFIMPNDGINSVYLAHCLTFFKSTLQNIANAPVVPIINKTQFSELEIPVFEVDKQQQFLQFVEQTDKSKLAVQNSIAALEELKKALMQKYFG